MIGGKYLNMIPSEMVGIAYVSKGASNQVDWRESMVTDLVAKTEQTLGGRSTILAKRECRCM
jgi:hypothetical protein